jgi:hypothetical protein
MFLRRALDVTSTAEKQKGNTLAVLVHPPDHPGCVDVPGQGADHQVIRFFQALHSLERLAGGICSRTRQDWLLKQIWSDSGLWALERGTDLLSPCQHLFLVSASSTFVIGFTFSKLFLFRRVVCSKSFCESFCVAKRYFHALSSFKRQNRHHLLLGLSVKRQSKVSTCGRFAVRLLQFAVRSPEGELESRELAFVTAMSGKNILRVVTGQERMWPSDQTARYCLEKAILTSLEKENVSEWVDLIKALNFVCGDRRLAL